MAVAQSDLLSALGVAYFSFLLFKFSPAVVEVGSLWYLFLDKVCFRCATICRMIRGVDCEGPFHDVSCCGRSDPPIGSHWETVGSLWALYSQEKGRAQDVIFRGGVGLIVFLSKHAFIPRTNYHTVINYGIGSGESVHYTE